MSIADSGEHAAAASRTLPTSPRSSTRSTSRANTATGRLHAEVPSSRAFLLLCAERGQNLGSTTAQLMRLLEGHGPELFKVALIEALTRSVCHIPTVRHILLQHAQAGPVPTARIVVLHGDPRVTDIVVRPHDLGDYDRLNTDH